MKKNSEISKMCGNIIIGVALISVIAFSNAKAIKGFMGYVGIKIPAAQKKVTMPDPVRKYSYVDQRYYNQGTVDLLTGAIEKIDVQVKCIEGEAKGSVSLWTRIDPESEKTIKGNNHSNIVSLPGLYEISFRRSTWTLIEGNHTGSWYLDDFY